MKSYWFGDVEGRACKPASGDPGLLAGRLAMLAGSGNACIPDWRIAVRCGAVRDRAEYLERLREAALILAERNLEQILLVDSSGLIQMVRMLDQLDEVINLLTERAVEWHRATRPGFSRKRTLPARSNLIALIREDADEALAGLLDEIDRLRDRRSLLMNQVSRRAEEILPNCSALAGGLVAARLVSEAGGIRELAALPASSIQVLGARTALFSHLATGTPPPKHGIVYQHGRVHNARRGTRGRVARTLSAKLAIAARIDYHRKSADREFLLKADEAVRKAGRRE
ncbi:MAG: RNA-processing protein [Methanomicrobiales archaeon]|nr:RNA-processing protein [Methanomicrobiales archaeon]